MDEAYTTALDAANEHATKTATQAEIQQSIFGLVLRGSDYYYFKDCYTTDI